MVDRLAQHLLLLWRCTGIQRRQISGRRFVLNVRQSVLWHQIPLVEVELLGLFGWSARYFFFGHKALLELFNLLHFCHKLAFYHRNYLSVLRDILGLWSCVSEPLSFLRCSRNFGSAFKLGRLNLIRVFVERLQIRAQHSTAHGIRVDRPADVVVVDVLLRRVDYRVRILHPCGLS